MKRAINKFTYDEKISLLKKEFIENFPGKFNWLVDSLEANTSNLPYIPLDKDVWTTNFEDNYHQLKTIFQISKNSSKITEYYGTYSEKLGLMGPNLRPSAQRRNFQGIPLTIYITIPVS